MTENPSRRDRPGTETGGRPGNAAEDAAARDFDAEGRPLARQEDEAAGTGAPGVDVGRPDAMPAEEQDGNRHEGPA
jgi:hypothetical protein